VRRRGWALWIQKIIAGVRPKSKFVPLQSRN
jgi:hypothetical protein